MFIEKEPIAIESTGPLTIVSPVFPTQAFAPHWATREGSSGLMDSAEVGELLSDATPSVDVAVLQCILIEEGWCTCVITLFG